MVKHHRPMQYFWLATLLVFAHGAPAPISHLTRGAAVKERHRHHVGSFSLRWDDDSASKPPRGATPAVTQAEFEHQFKQLHTVVAAAAHRKGVRGQQLRGGNAAQQAPAVKAPATRETNHAVLAKAAHAVAKPAPAKAPAAKGPVTQEATKQAAKRPVIKESAKQAVLKHKVAKALAKAARAVAKPASAKASAKAATPAKAPATKGPASQEAAKQALRHPGNASNSTKAQEPPLPPPPLEGPVFEVDSQSDPRKAWPSLEARASQIPGAGKGLFALRDLKNNTLLGEYVGKNFMMGERGSAKQLEADWSYIWKVPRCLAPKDKLVVITRADKNQAHACSNDHGFVYVDALPLDDPKTNPMRYVNGAMTEAQSKTVNVEAFFADDRVFYYTTRDVKPGDELMVDYGRAYWKEAKKEGDGPEEMGGDEMDWDNFAKDDDF